MCHTHCSPAENIRVCHWGFDPANWRSYLHLHEGYEEGTPERDRVHKRFQEFKARYTKFYVR